MVPLLIGERKYENTCFLIIAFPFRISFSYRDEGGRGKNWKVSDSGDGAICLFPVAPK